MADNEEGKETGPRGNEWEVVSLTASAYAAPPSPEQVDYGEVFHPGLDKDHEGETSNAMFMSSHFVFPPSQHENLPIEPEMNELCSEKGSVDDLSQLGKEEGITSDVKDEENSEYDEKGTEDSIGQLDGAVDPGFPNFQKPLERDIFDDADRPCEAWWKRKAFSVYAHAKETNTVWSVFIAATVTGLVILGHQWQHEKLQVMRIRWQFVITDERMGRLLAPISRLKEVVIGGHRRVSLLRGSTSSE